MSDGLETITLVASSDSHGLPTENRTTTVLLTVESLKSLATKEDSKPEEIVHQEVLQILTEETPRVLEILLNIALPMLRFQTGSQTEDGLCSGLGLAELSLWEIIILVLTTVSLEDRSTQIDLLLSFKEEIMRIPEVLSARPSIPMLFIDASTNLAITQSFLEAEAFALLA